MSWYPNKEYCDVLVFLVSGLCVLLMPVQCYFLILIYLSLLYNLGVLFHLSQILLNLCCRLANLDCPLFLHCQHYYLLKPLVFIIPKLSLLSKFNSFKKDRIYDSIEFIVSIIISLLLYNINFRYVFNFFLACGFS